MNAMRRLISIMLFVGLTMTGCSTEKPVPPPVQGPAVLGDGVVIDDWTYLGSNAVQPLPVSPLPAGAREVGTGEYEAWLVWTADGFDLVWRQFACATQPVVVVHAGVIEFWPGKIVTPDCSAAGRTSRSQSDAAS